MSNYHLRDKNLSNKSRGLLSTMLSLPDDWDYTVEGLASICKNGKGSISTQLNELEKTGYLVRTQTRDARGRIRDTEYTIYELPPSLPEASTECNMPPSPESLSLDPNRPDTTVPDTGLPYPGFQDMAYYATQTYLQFTADMYPYVTETMEKTLGSIIPGLEASYDETH